MKSGEKTVVRLNAIVKVVPKRFNVVLSRNWQKQMKFIDLLSILCESKDICFRIRNIENLNTC